MDLGLKGKVLMVAASSKGLGFGIAKQAAVFLLSKAASSVTGETFIIDGGKMRTVW